MRDCNDCGAKPGDFHDPGCDVERCALCGMQSIGCGCVYRVNGIARETLEETHPEVYGSGPTDEMYAVCDAAVEKVGGRLPWTGEWPGKDACREFGFWCYWSSEHGWVDCEKEHPEAMESLNRLVMEAQWNPILRRWLLPTEAADLAMAETLDKFQ